MNGIIDAFPLYQIWNSFDAVLYLYIDHKRVDKAFAEGAIRDLNKYMATDDEYMDPKKTEQNIQRLKKYNRYLEKISNVL